MYPCIDASKMWAETEKRNILTANEDARKSRHFHGVDRSYALLYKMYLALGLEGSANKFGAGIIQHLPNGDVNVLSNIRHTHITPPGEGFLPRDTALHHRKWALSIIRDALKKANVSMADLDCICFTKG